MARIYSRRRGRSGSSALPRSKHPSWAPTPKKVEAQVLKFAKSGLSTAVIGTLLRDTYGVPSVKLATGKSISDLLRAADAAPELPEDLTNLMQRAVRLGEHLERNTRDVHNQRALQLTESKILRLARYYRDSGRLDADWKYSLANAKLLVG
ncbi:MAG: 30S ribosomal protein S15 [Candidatus Thermoplasmatota archaeon]|nr:30S ribosomal protein S15 [Candidatus Thermoplasmatota archaeon]